MGDALCPVTEIQAPSSLRECRRLRKIVCRLASATLGTSDAVEDVELALGEAFSNAVKYGSARTISVRVKTRPGRQFALELVYPGRRFDTEVTPPPDMRGANGGFGRLLMKQVMDSMEYSFRDGRTTVRMTKKR
jgi:anti-sigma regulatory factor (Ser/Thr protein kinase)